MLQQLLITNSDKIYIPTVKDEIQWTTERKGTPGKLEFELIKDNILNIEEGNPVSLKIDNKGIFYGFIFRQKKSKSNTVKITAYDQLRYLKNKSSYIYTNLRADEVTKMIANDFQLNIGNIENTKHKIAKRSESNKSLFDIILNALDETIQYINEMYVLHDDYGKLNLTNISNMKIDIIIDEETAQDYDYETSIDSDTYNKIKLIYDNKETGKREVYIAQDTNNINKWGVLQYFDTIEEQTNGAVKAESLLKLYNQKTRNLQIKKAIGDIRVKAGTLIIVNLNLGDVILQNYMLVEKAKHTFKNGEHYMDLTLRGQDFIA